jgi:hypothetical protein
MKAWKIEYTILDSPHCDPNAATATYWEGSVPPTTEERVKCVLAAEHIVDSKPMLRYNEEEWIYDDGTEKIEIGDYTPVSTQRLIRVWSEVGQDECSAYVGDYDYILMRFPTEADPGPLVSRLANLLRTLGYIVSMHIGHQHWLD